MSKTTEARDSGLCSRRSALEYFLSRNPINTVFGKSLHFAEPTAEELAAQAAAKEAELIDKLTPKISEAIEKKYKTHLDGLSAEITRLKKAKDDVEKDKNKDDKEVDLDKEGLSAAEERKALRAKLTAIEKERAQEKAANLAKDEAIRKGNVTSDLQAVATKYCKMEGFEKSMRLELESEHPGKFVYDDARKTTVYKENEDDEGTPIVQWAEAQSKEGKFKKWIPGRSTTTKGPSNSAVSSSGDGKTEMSLAEMAQAHYQGKKIDWKKVATKE